jgi:hypothetical protein
MDEPRTSSRQSVASPVTPLARASANHQEAATPEQVVNPLWIMTAGLAIFFGAGAIVLMAG